MCPRKWTIMLAVLMFAGMPASASAEFYKYVDKDGNVYYTDNYGDIPTDQRPKASEYEEFKPELIPPPQGTAVDTGEVSPAEDTQKKVETQAENGEEKSREKRLTETVEKLKQEYQALAQEREQLAEESKGRMPSSDRKKLVDRIKNFNTKIKGYEERRQAFDKEVEEYNADIAKKATEAVSGN